MTSNKKKTNTKNRPGKKRNQEKITFPTNLLNLIGRFLAEEERKILKKIKNLKEEDPFANQDRTSNNASPDTDAEEQFGHMKNTAIRNQLRRRLIQVRRALAKVRIGQYGICEKCEKLIDTDRLMIYPETTICIKCLKKKEKGKK